MLSLNRIKRFVCGLLCVLLCVLASSLSTGVYAQLSIPTFEVVRQAYQASELELLDRQGQLLQLQRTNWQQRQGRWLALEHISPTVIRLLIRAEDRRFYEHSGVDWYGVAGSLWTAVWGQSLRGSSTLSMQLVDLLHLGPGRSLGARSWSAKYQQAQLAKQLEQSWSKPQIVEAYLNLVPLRGELIGIDAFARVLWNKNAYALSTAEAALAIAMLPSPNAPVSILAQRGCALLRAELLAPNCDTQAWYYQQAITKLASPGWGNPQLAPHLMRYMLRLQPELGLKNNVQSSVDAVVQRYAQKVLHRHLTELHASNVQDAAVLVLDNQTGQVIAYVGGHSLSNAAQVDHVQAKRQAGSTLKPFLYLQALAEQRITAASLLADTAAQFATPYGMYVPQNYDEQFMGWVSARNALAGSVNIPAVRLLAQVGVATFQRTLINIGIALPHPAVHYGLGLSLGGAELSLWQLSNAYRTLANHGLYSSACFLHGCQNRISQRLDPAASWIVQHILADNTARAMTFGLDSALNTPFWSAVKTGTSKDMRDNWTIGFSQHYTVGVWVGNSDGSAMHDISGVGGAAPIWHELMVFLHQALPSQPPAQPNNVVCEAIQYQPAIEAARNECFIQGTQRSRIVLQQNTSTTGKISAPLANTIYALDPEIPHEVQQIIFRADIAASDSIKWQLNGVPLSHLAQFLWTPQLGRHCFQLVNALTNQHLDTVCVEVRG